MFSKKLTFKVLAILGITLISGLLILGAVITWLQFNSSVELQLKNTRNLAVLIIRDIDGYMMKGDSKEVAGFVSEAKRNGYFLDLKIFNAEGKEPDSTNGSSSEPTIVKALNSENNIENKGMINGVHSLSIAVPLKNEERCKGCHDAAPKYLGAILLTTSIQDGYDSAFTLARMFLIADACFFFLILASIYSFFRRAIINNILKMRFLVDELASNDGDLTKTLPITSRDEIGDLAGGINRLIAKIQGIVARIAQNAVEVSHSAHQLASTSEKMVEGTQEVASQTEIAALASEQIATTSTEIARNCVQVADEARHVSDSASKGTAIIEGTIAIMGKIADKVKESASTIENLGRGSDQIGEIIGTIEDIADQTNLLALNAAIEAARAGEQGRGFAVVADEVRALAERTTKATREIDRMIKEIQSKTKEAVLTMEDGVREVEKGSAEAGKSGHGLQGILDQICSVTSQVTIIATAAEEQTSTVMEVSDNVSKVTALAQVTEKGAEETKSEAFRLAQLSEDLKQMVALFKQAV